MKCLYLFNPENDMALASGRPYYMPPASAKKMAADLAALPSWYADTEGCVYLPDAAQMLWMQKECRISLSNDWVIGEDFGGFGGVVPWGWSPALLRRLTEKGMESVFLPSDMQVVALRNLSSRKTAVELLPRLMMKGTCGKSFWLTSIDEALGFSSKYEKVLLKAPWSGSGKGIQPLSGIPDDNLCGWIRRIVTTQGGVVGEPFYRKVLDFAMEFKVSDIGLSFVGYSLFETDNRGIYKENLLASNESIERRLVELVSKDVLLNVRNGILRELSLMLGGIYQGYLGVDMMVVHAEEGYAVHPCVEVNLRMNMGVVSRLFFDRYMASDSCGRYLIEYYPRRGEALNFHEEMRRKHPLVIHGGRISEGYLSLTPVFEDTAYQIYVCVK